MDILGRLNSVIAYIEDHLLDEQALTPDQVAQSAMMPSAQFYRLFPYITDVTVREYIRRRRLTLAALELLSTDIRIIDASFKFGYESPDAFGRAFLAQHGVPPSAVRKPGVQIAVYPRLRFSITIKGDVSMNFQLTEKPAFTIMGKKMTVRHGEEENQTVPAFWGRSKQEPWFRKLCEICRTDLGVMGVCVSAASDVKFDYYIAIEKTGGADTTGFDTLEVPPSTWACFESVGPMPGAIQEVWKYVLTEWLPSSGYRHAGTPDLEVYALGDMDQADYRSYVWIPVVKA